ncbi:hypothetical protein M9H77_17079 [Catharanthus roseus]|uniref:Uncharacterized protein n=1 Tax=Catharanthus roseus TaxID=4058 RepID=A0ACC0B3L4_CATRO|nr:hypothetical protein M9H77_17079 [Catharanthus roseus]
MVCGSKKTRPHLDMSTSPTTTSTPPAASIPPGTFASPATTSTPPATLTLFPQLLYSSPAPLFEWFRKRYRWDPLHEHAIWDAWQKRASLRYKDLMYERAHMLSRSGRRHRGTVCRGMVPRGSASTLADLDHSMSGGRKWARHLQNQSCTSYCISKRDNGSTPEILGAKGEREHLHIEISSPIPTDEQLMFDVAGGSNKGHVYDFGSQSAAITIELRRSSSNTSSVPSVSSAAAHNACSEREKWL